eukprot:15451925-Alexandrium_andersonii.AAC.1
MASARELKQLAADLEAAAEKARLREETRANGAPDCLGRASGKLPESSKGGCRSSRELQRASGERAESSQRAPRELLESFQRARESCQRATRKVSKSLQRASGELQEAVREHPF